MSLSRLAAELCNKPCAGDAELSVGGVAKVAKEVALVQINEVGSTSLELFYYECIIVRMKENNSLANTLPIR